MKRGAAVCFAISLLLAASAAGAAATTLTQAQWWRQPVDGPLAHAPSTQPPPAAADWVDWTLAAHRFDTAGPAGAAQAARGASLAWVRWRFEPPARAAGEPLALYLPVSMLEHYEWVLNGQPVAAQLGPRARYQRTWNRPLLIELPDTSLRAGANELLLATYPYRWPYLVAPRLGPKSELGWRANWRIALQLDLPRALQWLFAATGLFALLAGWRQREPMYLLFGAAALAWVLRLLHYTWEPIPSAAGVAWIDWLTVNSLVWVVGLTFSFSARLVGLRPWRIERGVVVATVLLALATLPGVGPLANYALAPWIYAVTGAASVGLLALVSVRARRQRDAATFFMALALWTMFAFGIHDLLLMVAWVPATSMFLMPLAALPLMASFAYAAAARHARSVAEARRLNVELADRVRAAYDELAAAERQRVLAEERARLMRDMHDGLGGSLMSSLAMVEAGRMPPGQVAATLRECIEDLQLTIDSLEPAGDDLLALLGALRYRLGKRLEAAGLTIDWAVQPLPALPWLDPAAALHVLRIVQEVLTNIVKHAQARRVRVETAHEGGSVIVRIADDGRGFDPAQARGGRGLGNLRRRAAELGGTVEFVSGPAGTVATLRLPLQRDA